MAFVCLNVRHGCGTALPTLLFGVAAIIGGADVSLAQSSPAGIATVEEIPPIEPILVGPTLVQTPQPVPVVSPQPERFDQPLPINLATVLYLSNARPLVIASAQASVQLAAAAYEGASVLGLPNLTFGVGYVHHEARH